MSLNVPEVEVYALRITVEDQKCYRVEPGCGYGPYGTVDFYNRFLTICCNIGVSGAIAFLRASHYYSGVCPSISLFPVVTSTRA